MMENREIGMSKEEDRELIVGNVYEIAFEAPFALPGCYPNGQTHPPVKVCAISCADAIQKYTAQTYVCGLPIASVKLVLPGVSW
jgi:hypothetical protein